ncbi:putative albumin I chain a [Medicago truncatula]|uniref:Leginsulin/Albumin-1 n=1 Tax=Medicago truncatula TaxID=3880 RepID=G7KHS2_MEDTR|nr:albumin-1 B [Medicago truncatula]AES75294.1 Leginsulin/Albumin-1 [Medicago truncatula]RHN51037.1 putative albumin I chain a [Medicago truncatula]
MAYFKLASLAVFLLATFLMFPTKNVEAQSCSGAVCIRFNTECDAGCYCHTAGTEQTGVCRPNVDGMEMEERHPYLCQSHDECNKKGSGSFCARSPNSDNKNGWCFASFSEAQEYFKFTAKYKFKRDFLKMPITA